MGIEECKDWSFEELIGPVQNNTVINMILFFLFAV